MIREERNKFEKEVLLDLKKTGLYYNGKHEAPEKFKDSTIYSFTFGESLNHIRIKVLVSETNMIEIYIDAVDQANHLFILNHNFTYINLDMFTYTVKKFAELVNLKL